MKHVIALGAGVQSSTLALMAARGEIGPMPDAAVFADTGAEPDAVYKWLDWLETQLPFPVYRTQFKDLSKNIAVKSVSKKSGKQYANSPLPLWMRNANGSRGIISRRCTRDYKIQIIHQLIKTQVLGMGKYARLAKITDPVVTQWIGISLDEASRMKPSIMPWIKVTWPLIDQKMTRKDCLEWMAKNGYPTPPRSACVFCPFHSNTEWQRLKDEEPHEFAKAVKAEKEIQEVFKSHCQVTRAEPFLWQGLKPLDSVENFVTGEDIEHMDNECTGVCGV